MTFNAEEAQKLLCNGFRIVLFQDGIGEITAVAVPQGTGLNAAIKEWREHDVPLPPEGATEEDRQEFGRALVFDGPNRFAAGGQTVAAALHALAEKVIFGRLPKDDQ